MNYRIVAKYLGHFTFAVAVIMLPSAICAIIYQEWSPLAAFGKSILAAVLLGSVLSLIGNSAPDRMFQREGLALVGIGWLQTAAISALPFYFSGTLGPIDAYFEAMSGLTTTGSTVLLDIEATPASILFWRSFTHWIGGMGIVVLFIAVLPYLGAGGKQLFKSESSGPDPRGLSPRIKDTAKALWGIYLVFTVIQTVLLMCAGMNLYDALVHTFGTLATGGFSSRNASIAAYDSVLIEFIIIVFMILCGTNFGLYFAMLHGDRWAMLKNTEWRVFIVILAVVILLITCNLMGMQGQLKDDPVLPNTPDYSWGQALRHSAFIATSLMTSTGYGTEDFDQWPHFSRLLLVIVMCLGCCAGSTSGGIKVVRLIILFKMCYWRLEGTFRPKTVRPIRINGQVVDDDMQRSIFSFFVIYVSVFLVSALYLSFIGLPFQTALSAVAATINNAGPGLELVGPTRNFSFIPDSGKVVLSVCMAMGRLELFSLGVLFVPSFWRHA